jgi:hypothetical protein
MPNIIINARTTTTNYQMMHCAKSKGDDGDEEPGE